MSARNRDLFLSVAVALVALGLYVGAYYAIVTPVRMPGRTETNFTDLAGSLFAPIHWLDRHIRPHVWKRPLTPRERDFLSDPTPP